LEDKIIRAIELFEPRAKVLNVSSQVSPDSHEVKVSVTFQVISTLEVLEVEISLTRLR
jgi:predicted component of type VI protein secretion system